MHLRSLTAHIIRVKEKNAFVVGTTCQRFSAKLIVAESIKFSSVSDLPHKQFISQLHILDDDWNALSDALYLPLQRQCRRFQWFHLLRTIFERFNPKRQQRRTDISIYQ